MTSPSRTSGAMEDATYRKITLRLMPFLFLCYIMAYINRVNVSFAKIGMQADLGMSDEVYGFGAGIFFIGYFFFNVPSNMILKKVGARWLLGPMLITCGIVSALLMFVHGSVSYYVLRFICGALEAGFFPGVILYLTFWYTAKYRGRMMALFMSAIPISGIFAGPVSGWILKGTQGAAGLAGWQWLYVLYGIPCSLVGLGVICLLSNDPEKAAWLTAEEKKLVLRNLEIEHEANKRAGGAKSKLSDAFKNGAVWVLALVYFGVTAANYGIGFYLPQVIKDQITKDPVMAGWLYAIPWVVTTVVMFVVGKHSDKTGERRWHLALSCLLGGATFALSAIPGVPGMVGLALLTVSICGVLCGLTLLWTLPASLLAGTAAAAGIAWINALGNLGGYAAPHAAGIIVDKTHNTAYAMVVLGGCMLMSGILTLLVTRKGVTRQ